VTLGSADSPSQHTRTASDARARAAGADTTLKEFCTKAARSALRRDAPALRADPYACHRARDLYCWMNRSPPWTTRHGWRCRRTSSRIIRQEHKTAVLVTHDISEAISMSDRVIVVLTHRPGTWCAPIHDLSGSIGDLSPHGAARYAESFRTYFQSNMEGTRCQCLIRFLLAQRRLQYLRARKHRENSQSRCCKFSDPAGGCIPRTSGSFPPGWDWVDIFVVSCPVAGRRRRIAGASISLGRPVAACGHLVS
jgi:hypothetical protein